MASCIESLRALLDALPRCCACEKDYAVVFTIERRGLCEKCWKLVPSGDYPAVHDMRKAVYNAIAALALEDFKRGDEPPP